jgi:hypothetical protein
LWNAIVDNGGQESACGWQIKPCARRGDRRSQSGAAKRTLYALMQIRKIDIAAMEVLVNVSLAAARLGGAGQSDGLRGVVGTRCPPPRRLSPKNWGWCIAASGVALFISLSVPILCRRCKLREGQ